MGHVFRGIVDFESVFLGLSLLRIEQRLSRPRLPAVLGLTWTEETSVVMPTSRVLLAKQLTVILLNEYILV